MAISTNILDLSLAVGVGAEWLVLLLDASVKGLALLVLASVVTLLMRKVSAAERQLVWAAALAGLLVLPVVSVALPGWQVLPNWRQAAPPAALGPGPQATVPQLPQPQPPPALETQETPAPGHTPAAPVIPDAAPPAMPVESQETPALAAGTIMAWVLVISALGATVCLAPMVLGRLSLWRLRRGGRPLTDGPWSAMLKQVSEQLGVGRRVALLRSDRCTMPMVWGVFWVRLLLPGEAADWSAERRRIVLLHELAHVKRWDCLVKIVTQLACAVYWFNPLVWLAAKRVQDEGERACDDLVLAAGNRPSDYAEHLVEISSGLQAGRLAVHSSIAMVRPAKLEGRVRAILNSTRIRRAIKRRAILIAAVLAIGITILLACMQSHETMEADPVGPAVATPGEPPVALASTAGDRTDAAGADAEPSDVERELRAYYDAGDGPPWQHAVDTMLSADEAASSEAAAYLCELLAQLLADELSGAAPWRAPPIRGMSGHNPARTLRASIARLLSHRARNDAALPVYEWFLTHEKLSSLQVKIMTWRTCARTPQTRPLSA